MAKTNKDLCITPAPGTTKKHPSGPWEHICKHCRRKLVSRSNKMRHLKDSCKVLKVNEFIILFPSLIYLMTFLFLHFRILQFSITIQLWFFNILVFIDQHTAYLVGQVGHAIFSIQIWNHSFSILSFRYRCFILNSTIWHCWFCPKILY